MSATTSVKAEPEPRVERAGSRRSESGAAPPHAEDRLVGAVVGVLAVAFLLGSAVLARYPSLPTRIGLLLLWTSMACAGAVVGFRARHHFRPPRSIQVRPPDRTARHRRFWAFTVGAAACAAGSAAVVLLSGWTLVVLVPGLLLAASTGTVRFRRLSLRPSRPLRWIPALVALLAVPALFSLEVALTADSSDPMSIRAVEWLRDHGGAGVVDSTEHWWYTNHAPPVGGTPSTVPSAPPAAERAMALTPLRTPAATPLPGEGQWTVTAGTTERPAVATTFLRPDPVHTSIVVGVLRIDPSQVHMDLIAGTEQPGGPAPSGGAVPAADRGSLVAAFNAGFRMSEANGGWYSAGRTAVPLRDGSAALVLRDDGRADVGVWGRDDRMEPHVTAVRQNLALIVDGGRLVSGTEDAANLLWGKTLGHKVLVNRSGVGITADGALVYVGGPGLSVATLGRTLVAAGAVRAMEMDINTAWVNAFTYVPGPNGPTGTKLVDTMTHGADRYLRPQTRDFVAVTMPGAHQ